MEHHPSGVYIQRQGARRGPVVCRLSRWSFLKPCTKTSKTVLMLIGQPNKPRAKTSNYVPQTRVQYYAIHTPNPLGEPTYDDPPPDFTPPV